MKISDFGLSRDVYEEDSYVKRSKVKTENDFFSAFFTSDFINDFNESSMFSRAGFPLNGWQLSPCLIIFTQHKVTCKDNCHFIVCYVSYSYHIRFLVRG